MTRAGEGRHGFTLIELLVSLTIFSIIAVAVYSAFAGGVGAWRRAQEFSSTYQTARLVLDDMAHELKNAVTLSGTDFIGEKQGLSFLTVRQRPHAQGRPVDPKITRVTYEVRRPSLRASEGSVLIQVLWTLAILVLLGLALGYTTALDQRLVSYQRDRLTALYLAKAGYVRALVELERAPIPQTDSYLDSWANNPDAFRLTPLGPGSFTVSYALPGQDPPAGVVYGIVDEDRKININTAPKAILARLPGMTEEVADALLEWRAKHKSLVVIEDKPFKLLEELWLVDGMTHEVFQALEPYH